MPERTGQGDAPRGAQRPPKTRLETWYLIIIALPVAVLIVSDVLITNAGWPVAPSPAAEFKRAVIAYDESAARMRVLIGFLLLVCASLGAAGYAFLLFLKAEARTIAKLAGASALAALLVFAYFQWGSRPPLYAGVAADEVQTQQLADQMLMCRAAFLGEAEAPRPVTLHPESCGARRFQTLRELVRIQRYALAVALIALVSSTLLCLGERPAQKGERPQRVREARCRLLDAQMHRLTMVLYLSAFMLVSGLFFLSAFLHYPSFALNEADASAYGGAAKMIVMFYAVSYSLLIAAFYIPAAAVLTQRWESAPRGTDGGSGKGPALVSTVQLFKAGAAILSPIMAGLLSQGVQLPGLSS